MVVNSRILQRFPNRFGSDPSGRKKVADPMCYPTIECALFYYQWTTFPLLPLVYVVAIIRVGHFSRTYPGGETN